MSGVISGTEVRGITVVTTVSIDEPHELGEHLASLSSDLQARIFSGLACGMATHQPLYIAEAIAASNAADTVLEFLDDLAALIRHQQLKAAAS